MEIQGPFGRRLHEPTQQAPEGKIGSAREHARDVATQVAPIALRAGMTEFQATRALSATNTSSMTPAATTTAATGTAGWINSAGTAMGIAGGVIGAYTIASQWGKSTPAQGAASGAAVGAAIGTVIPGIGTVIGAGVGAIAGGLIGTISAGKHQDQKARDSLRDILVQSGVLSRDFTITLADGTSYNMGLDGDPRDELHGRRPYEVDFSNPLSGVAVGWLNPLLDLFCGGNEKLKLDFTGYFANAATAHAKTIDDVRNNVGGIIEKFGATDAALTEGVLQAEKSGRLAPDIATAYLNGIRDRIEGPRTVERSLP